MCNFSAKFLWQESKKFKRYLILDMTIVLPTKITKVFICPSKWVTSQMENFKKLTAFHLNNLLSLNRGQGSKVPNKRAKNSATKFKNSITPIET